MKFNLDNVKTKWSLSLATTLVALNTTVPVFANGDNPFTQVDSGLTSFQGQLRTISTGIAVVALILCGIMFMGGDKLRAKGLSWAPWVVAGIALISAAIAIVTWTQGAFGS